MMIAIVDYGMGNLRSVSKALERVGCATALAETPEAVMGAEKLVVPGVGAFGDAMKELERKGLVGPIREYARSGRPLMGICLGMQVFFESSEEDPGIEGLCLLRGTVRRFTDAGLKIPHMGWNSLAVRKGSRLLAGLGESPHVYFVHSYYVAPEDEGVAAAMSAYGERFTAAVETGNLVGTQFHPEKSQATGLRILGNFASM